MGLLRWRWTLANGGAVEASLDDAGATEMVFQEGMVLSRAARHAKPQGHTVSVAPMRHEGHGSDRPPLEAILTFASHAPICVLRVDGHEVAPSLWPKRDRTSLPGISARPARQHPAFAAGGLVARVALAGVGIVILAVAFIAIRAMGSGPPAPVKLGESLRALNGLFIAHFPEEMTQRMPTLPMGMFGVRLDDRTRRTAIVLAAGPRDVTAGDRWALQQRLLPEILANLKKVDETFEETARREELCLGEPGAVIVGRLVEAGKPVARLWTCAILHDDAGYMLVSRIAEPVEKDEENSARRIVDATELTHLAELAPAPAPSN